MSRSVDERVVQMQFNNSQFESGVRNTLSTLDKLKQSLKFDNAGKGLSGLKEAFGKLSITGLGGLASGVDKISNKFSALGIMGVAALSDIARQALHTGQTMIKSLTIDPIKDGMSEYEKKINSIAVILTNTEKKGTTMDDITKALNELNEYSDKTIYNFATMADSIGKFTAKGVALQPAVDSVKGIANLGAATGASAQQVSGAMYQISQAIGTGLKAIDYMSIENASLSGTIFEDRLKAEAKALGTWTKAEEKAFKEGKSFRQTLETGWVTGQVLQNVLEDLGKDEALTKKAGEVRTLTSLLSTMKESVASGWAQTWEQIFGDKNEATKLFTSLNDAFSAMIGPSTDARNSMLKTWKELGGREDLIYALQNAFFKLTLIIDPIKRAFEEIFPKKTLGDIMQITHRIRRFFEELMIGIEAMYFINKIAKGFFAAISIGIQFIKALGNAFVKLVGKLKPAGKGFRDLFATISDWLVELDKALKRGDTFAKAFEKITDFLADIINNVSQAFLDFIDNFDIFDTADVSGITRFVDDVQLEFKPLEKIGGYFTAAMTFIKTVWPKIKMFLDTAWVEIKNAFEKFKVFVAGVGSGMGEALGSMTKEDVIKIFEGGLLGAILIGVIKLVGILKEFASGALSFVKGITDVLDGVRNSLATWQTSIKAKTISKIAKAVALLAAAILILSMIKPENLMNGMAAITAIFVELFGSMIAFEKIAGKETFSTIKKVSGAMIMLSVAVLLLSFAVKKLGKMELAEMGQGLLGVAGILIGFGVFLKTGNFDSGSFIKQAIAILFLALAVNALGGAVKKFGQMDPNELLQGMASVASVLIGFAGLSYMMAKDSNFIKAGIGIFLIASALGKVQSAIESLGKMDESILNKGLYAMGVSLGIITVALNMMPKTMFSTGSGFALVALGIGLLANSLKLLGEMKPEQVGQALIALMTALGTIVVLMNAFETAVLGALALVIVTAALFGLAIVLKILASIPIEQIGTALLAMLGVMVLVIGFAAAMGAIMPLVLAAAAGLLGLGIGMAIAAGGFFLMSIALGAFTIAVIPAVAAMIPFIAQLAALALLNLVPYVLAGGLFLMALSLGAAAIGLVIFGAAALVAGAGAMVAGFGFTMLAAGFMLLSQVDFTNIAGINDYAGDILKASLKLLLAAPGLIAGGAGLITFGSGALMTGAGLAMISLNIMEVVKSLENVPSLVIMVGQLLLVTLMTLMSQINSLLEKERDTIYDIVKDTLMNSLHKINSTRSMWVSSGESLVDGFVQGIRSKARIAAQAAATMAGQALKAANQRLEIESPSGAFEDTGKFADMGLAKGLKKYAHLAADAAEKVGERTLRPVLSLATANPGSINMRSNTPSYLDSSIASISRGLQNGTTMQRTLDSLSSMAGGSQSSMDLSGVLTVQVKNDRGEIIGIAQTAIKDLLRRESR